MYVQSPLLLVPQSLGCVLALLSPSLTHCLMECYLHAGIETEQDPVGLLGTKAFLCPPFLDFRK